MRCSVTVTICFPTRGGWPERSSALHNVGVGIHNRTESARRASSVIQTTRRSESYGRLYTSKTCSIAATNSIYSSGGTIHSIFFQGLISFFESTAPFHGIACLHSSIQPYDSPAVTVASGKNPSGGSEQLVAIILASRLASNFRSYIRSAFLPCKVTSKPFSKNLLFNRLYFRSLMPRTLLICSLVIRLG